MLDVHFLHENVARNLHEYVRMVLKRTPHPAGTTKHENETVISIHFQFNILGSEATSLFDIGRWTFDVGRSFSYKLHTGFRITFNNYR
jgi:hypothetical protein